MPFPLLRLPYLAFSEVMKNFEIRQLFPLSLCSKRMHLVVKNLRYKSIESKLDLRSENNTTRFSLSTKNAGNAILYLNVSAIRENQKGGWRVEEYPESVFQQDYSGSRRLWEDVKNGTRCLMKRIFDLFNAKVDKVFVEQNKLWILDLVEELQGPRSYEAHCGHIRRTNDQYRHLLVDLNPASLSILSEPSKQFRIENFRKTYNNLHLHGGWITWENMLRFDCARLFVHKTYTVNEINRLFRHVLLEGGAARMTEFRAQVEDIDENGILDGIRELLAPIPGRDQFEDNERSWKFSGTLARGDQLVFASITCERHWWRGIRLEIGEKDVLD